MFLLTPYLTLPLWAPSTHLFGQSSANLILKFLLHIRGVASVYIMKEMDVLVASQPEKMKTTDWAVVSTSDRPKGK